MCVYLCVCVLSVPSKQQDQCCGSWRGGIDLEDQLPVEQSSVLEFIQGVSPGPVYLFYGYGTPPLTLLL